MPVTSVRPSRREYLATAPNAARRVKRWNDAVRKARQAAFAARVKQDVASGRTTLLAPKPSKCAIRAKRRRGVMIATGYGGRNGVREYKKRSKCK